MLLKDKKVLITGAGRGIGRHIAISMANEGAIILGVSQSEEPLAEMAAMVRNFGGKAYTSTMDIASYEEGGIVIPALVEAAGGLDILVNCAAIFKEAFFVDMTPEEWQQTVSIDLNGIYNVTHVAIPYIIKAKGAVINIISQDAFTGCPGYSHYSACKAAIVGLTRTLARELGVYGVRINCVAPGVTETDMMKDRLEVGLQGYLDKLPVGRIGKPEDIANSVVFLASEKSSFITGQIIHCNGGMYLG